MKKIFYILIITLSVSISFYIFTQKYPFETKISEKVSADENSILRPKDETISSVPKITQNPAIKRIILITIDTLRADHLGFMEYKRSASPFLDKLAKSSIVFKNAFTVYPMTGPSHASILTGLYPDQHHVLDNGAKLNDDVNTMAEYFQKINYKTAAFISNHHLNVTNFQQGFDKFNFEYSNENMQENFGQTVSPRRTSEETIAAAELWLDSTSPEDNFFLWIHIFDQHLPYKKSLSFISSNADSIKADKDLLDYWQSQGVDMNLYKAPADKNMSDTINKYDATIQYTDNRLKNLYDYFSSKNLNNKALWVITNDHGEGLGSHYYYDHDQRIYNEQLKTPIIFHNPDHENGAVYNDIVENVDIFPTLIDLTGGKQNFSVWPHGLSLVPIIAGADGEKEYAFASRYQSQGETNLLRKTPIIDVLKENMLNKSTPAKQYSLQDTEYKYIYKVNTSDKQMNYNDEFYNLQNDPFERKNLINEPSEKKDKMKTDLTDHINTLQSNNTPVSATTDVSPDAAESLRALGY